MWTCVCHKFCVQIGSPSAPVLEFLEEWTTEPLEEIACSIIPSSTKVCGVLQACSIVQRLLGSCSSCLQLHSTTAQGTTCVAA